MLDLGEGTTRATTSKVASGDAAWPWIPVAGGAIWCRTARLPTCAPDECVVHRHWAAGYCRGHRAAAILAGAPTHDRGPWSSVGHHGTRQDHGRTFTGEQECGSAPPGCTEHPGRVGRILLLSLSIRQTSRTVSSIRTALAIAGLAGTVLSTVGQFAGSSLYLGLGVGGMERVSATREPVGPDDRHHRGPVRGTLAHRPTSRK